MDDDEFPLEPRYEEGSQQRYSVAELRIQIAIVREILEWDWTADAKVNYLRQHLSL